MRQGITQIMKAARVNTDPTRCFVTTSWDDGHLLDLRLAEILSTKGVCATFYIPRLAPYRSLPDSCIRDLSQAFEVGAHSLTHPHLTEIDDTQLRHEVEGSKGYIEDIIATSCDMFCYPSGTVDSRVVSAVQQAGFRGGRTVYGFCDGSITDPYRLTTTIQACTHSQALTKLSIPPAHLTSLDAQMDLSTIPLNKDTTYNWLALARRTFDLVRIRNGVWHLWGHSWEIEQCQLWDELDELLSYIMACPGVVSVTNSQLLDNRAAWCSVQ